MAAESGFLGRGWGFLLDGQGVAGVSIDAFASVAEASGDEKIRQSIWLILATAPGERVGRPTFGCGVHDLVFSTRTAGTMGEVIRAVTDALTQWEPRIELLAVDATPDPVDASGVLVGIQYRVRATNSRYNLVYPFYLSP